MGWAIAKKVRSALTQGGVNASYSALALLHLIFVDLIEDPHLAVQTVLKFEAMKVRRIGKRLGVLWWRPHFVEPTWLPIQCSTWQLLQKSVDSGTSHKDLMLDVSVAVAQLLPTADWPETGEERLAFLHNSAMNYARLELPPSLVALSSINVPAPTLSLSSLQRLSRELGNELPSIRPPERWYRQSRTNSRDEGLVALAVVLNKYSDHKVRRGELRRRAIDCNNEVLKLNVRWTPFSALLRDWVCEELVRSQGNVDGRYQISSLLTYFSTLSLSRHRVHNLGEPAEWGDIEWANFLQWTNELASPPPPATQEVRGVCERVRHAASALVHSLRRRQIQTPPVVWELLHEHADPLPGGSSSSVLVRDEDICRAVQISRMWLADSPVDALLLEIRALLSKALPSRGGDLSSLAWDCLTQADGIVIRRMGYNQHKSENSIRVTPISASCALELRSLRAKLEAFTGATTLLLRQNGSPEAGLRDAQLLDVWTAALKVATNDQKARPHSVRATALQARAWPGWEAEAAAWLSAGTVDSRRVGGWVDSLHAHWTRTAGAAAAAGHGDLRSAMGNYLAGWPLIRAMCADALLRRLQVGPGLVRQLGLNPVALRKARSRAARSEAVSQQFDSWTWLQASLSRNRLAKLNAPLKAPALSLPPRSEPARVSRFDSVSYLVVRALGMTRYQAIECIGIPDSASIELEALVPDGHIQANLTRRARSSVRERGAAANMKLARSEVGTQIIDWVIRLDRASQEFFRLCVLRESEATSLKFYCFHKWQPILESIPRGLCLSIRRGKAHITADELRFHRSFGQLMLKLDDRIGARPIVSLAKEKQNLVLEARLTAVLRSTLYVTRFIKEE